MTPQTGRRAAPSGEPVRDVASRDVTATPPDRTATPPDRTATPPDRTATPPEASSAEVVPSVGTVPSAEAVAFIEPAPFAKAAPFVEAAPSVAAAPSTRVGPESAVALRGGVLLLIGMLLVAVNLRAAITSLGALLDEVRTGLGLSGTLAGVVTTMPALAFAAFGALTPLLVRRFAAPRLMAGSMVLLALGQALRVATDSALLFIVTSALALAGIAVANILLPMLVKQYFPHRAGLVTSAYTMTVVSSTGLGAATAVPVAHAFGSWRAGLGIWALLATVAILPWIPGALRARRARPATRPAATPARRIRPARTRLGWTMAIYFGTQSLSGYAIMGWLAQLFRDSGHSAQNAGLLLAGVTALGIPVALVIPAAATRLATLRPIVLIVSVASVVAYLGLAMAPYELALLWVALLAVGQGGFPLILTIIGLRARTSQGTVALSAFAQSIGYLIAALGPLLVGLFYEATGGWHVPLSFMTGSLLLQTAAGLAIARPAHIEDEDPQEGAPSAVTASSTVG